MYQICSILSGGLIQSIDGVGFFIPEEGEKQVGGFFLQLFESPDPSPSDSVPLFVLERLGGGGFVTLGAVIPDESLTITECNGEEG